MIEGVNGKSEKKETSYCHHGLIKMLIEYQFKNTTKIWRRFLEKNNFMENQEEEQSHLVLEANKHSKFSREIMYSSSYPMARSKKKIKEESLEK